MARELIMPRLSDSMEEGTILKWLVAEGDTVREGQPLVEVETDKAVVTHEADSDGTVLSLIADEGATVPVGAPIAIVGQAGESAPAREAGGARGARGARVKASPLARRIASELDVDIAGVAGSGPQGRVIRADVERAATAPNGGAAGNEAPPAAAEPASSDAGRADGARGQSTAHQLTRLQQTVARRMSESRATIPDIELRNEVDMTDAVALREQLRGVAGDALPSFNDLIVKAAAMALREFPRVNGAYRDAQLIEYSRVNVGIAVATEDGLVVPTVFDADTKSLGAIANTTRTLAKRVRDGSVTPAELGGATFSISNLGMHGIDSFSAVINPPQAAILAVGTLRPRPVVDDSGQIVARETIQLSLACDHRIVYGVHGARFLARVRELLQSPLSLLL